MEAGCRRNFMGMNRDLCEEKTTQLYLANNASASRVWLVEPLVPSPPTITAAAVAGGRPAGILVVTLTPPEFSGYFAISKYTLSCAPARGPIITVVGLGRSAGGGQVRVRAGAGSGLHGAGGSCCQQCRIVGPRAHPHTAAPATPFALPLPAEKV